MDNIFFYKTCKYIVFLLILLIICIEYVPQWILKYIDNSITRVIFLFLITLTATRDFSLALLIIIIYMLLLAYKKNFTNKNKLIDYTNNTINHISDYKHYKIIISLLDNNNIVENEKKNIILNFLKSNVGDKYKLNLVKTSMSNKILSNGDYFMIIEALYNNMQGANYFKITKQLINSPDTNDDIIINIVKIIINSNINVSEKETILIYIFNSSIKDSIKNIIQQIIIDSNLMFSTKTNIFNKISFIPNYLPNILPNISSSPVPNTNNTNNTVCGNNNINNGLYGNNNTNNMNNDNNDAIENDTIENDEYKMNPDLYTKYIVNGRVFDISKIEGFKS
jgi:hypothetical protein